MTLEPRHVAARGLIKFNNAVGWICVVTIILLPVGLLMLVSGHLCLAQIETEENTRGLMEFFQREYVRVKSVG